MLEEAWRVATGPAGNFVGLAVGVIGLWLTVVANNKQKQLQREKQTVSWEDVRLATIDLRKQMQRKLGPSWKPDLIFVPGPAGAVISSMLLEGEEVGTPCIAGVFLRPTKANEARTLAGYRKFVTRKWVHFLPECLFADDVHRVLFVDDIVMTGASLELYRRQIETPTREFVSATIVVSSTAKTSGVTPDFYWMARSEAEFYWPWGANR